MMVTMKIKAEMKRKNGKKVKKIKIKMLVKMKKERE